MAELHIQAGSVYSRSLNDALMDMMERAPGTLISLDAYRVETPLYASPGRLPDHVVQALIRRTRSHQSDPRKQAQALRDRILRSQHDDDIRAYNSTLYGKEHAKKVNKFVNTVTNPAADVVTGVVQLYRSGALRRIDAIDGVHEDEQLAFHQLVMETGIDTLAHEIAEASYFGLPQYTIPVMRRRRMRFQLPPAYCVDQVLDIEDPTADAVAIAYPTGAGEVAVLDGEALRVFVVTETAIELVSETPHGYPDMPAAQLRFKATTEAGNHWCYDVHSRLVGGALVVGHVAAKLELVRKAQHGKLLHVDGDLSEMPKKQVIGDPDGPVLTRKRQGIDGTDVDALDFDTDPRNHISHMRFLIERMAESTGVPVTVETGGDRFDLQWDYDALAEQRAKQYSWALSWERQLWTYTVAIAKRNGHPLASRLPEPDVVAEGFYLTLPPLHRKFADPLTEQSYWEWKLQHGQASYLDLARRYIGPHPDKVLIRKLHDNLRINTTIWNALATRNQPMDPSQGPAVVDTSGRFQTAAQAQGSIGAAVRDGKMLPPDGGQTNGEPEGS